MIVDSYLFIGPCLVISALIVLIFFRPAAFYTNYSKGLVIDEFFKRYHISDLEIIEKEAFIRHLQLDLSHLSDEEMVYT